MEPFLNKTCIIMHVLYCMYLNIMGLDLTWIIYKDPGRTA